MQRILFTVFLGCAFSILLAQNGDYAINDHTPSIPSIDHTAYDIAFDYNGLMYAANRSGVLRYDGSYWEFVKTPTAIFSLAVDSTNKIYVGGLNTFGYLDLQDQGLIFNSLSPDSLSEENFKSIKIIGDSIVFLGTNQLWAYHPKTGEMNLYNSPDQFEFISVISDGQHIYANTIIASYHWDGTSMLESAEWIGESYPALKLELSPDQSKYLMLDLTGKLFYETPNSGLTQVFNAGENVKDVRWINDSLFVTSTRSQGCFIINANDWELAGKMDYDKGLPDDEILTLEVDRGLGVWVAHQFGFSRVDPMAPVRCLSNYDGLDGNLIQSLIYEGDLLVATSSGLYKRISDSVYYVAADQSRLTKSEEKSPLNDSKFDHSRSIYQKVLSIPTKVNDLKILDDVVLVGSNDGLYEFDGKSAVKILTRPVKKIILSKDSTGEFLIIDDKQKTDRYSRKNRLYTNLPFGNRSSTLTSYYDRKSLVWLVGPGEIQALGVTINGAAVIEKLDFPNEHFENPTVVELFDDLYFIANSGYFKYDYKQKTLTLDSTLTESLGWPVEHMSGAYGSFWVFNGKVWKHIKKDGQATTYPYLSLFSNLRHIHQENDGLIYFINEQNKLFEYYPSKDRNDVYQSNVFYKHLYTKSAYSKYKQQLDLEYDENYLEAEISQPDYLGLLKVEFQHKVDGVDDEWSQWSPNNKLDINFLPDGSYKLNVRSKDVFGRIQSIEPITLVIHPPYWRSPWFYFMEVVLFASLVIISTRLNQSKAQNRFLTEGLTILTIVMIVETVQSAASSYLNIASTAFFDFLINLSIALIIFPLEILLKKIIKDGKIPIPKKRVKKSKT